jgi:hypothetical protein
MKTAKYNSLSMVTPRGKEEPICTLNGESISIPVAVTVRQLVESLPIFDPDTTELGEPYQEACHDYGDEYAYHVMWSWVTYGD